MRIMVTLYSRIDLDCAYVLLAGHFHISTVPWLVCAKLAYCFFSWPASMVQQSVESMGVTSTRERNSQAVSLPRSYWCTRWHQPISATNLRQPFLPLPIARPAEESIRVAYILNAPWPVMTSFPHFALRRDHLLILSE